MAIVPRRYCSIWWPVLVQRSNDHCGPWNKKINNRFQLSGVVHRMICFAVLPAVLVLLSVRAVMPFGGHGKRVHLSALLEERPQH